MCWGLAQALRSLAWPPHASRFPPVREAGARTEDALFTPACSPPPSVALRPRVAARSSLSGASLRRRRPPGADAKRSSSPSGLKSGGTVPTRRQLACYPTPGGKPSTSVRVPGRVVSPRAFRCGMGRYGARLMIEQITGLNRSKPACSAPPSVAMRPRVAARSPMSGVSWWGMGRTGADAKRSSSRLGGCGSADTTLFGGRVTANGSRAPAVRSSSPGCSSIW
jgi:hypothetical protein